MPTVPIRPPKPLTYRLPTRSCWTMRSAHAHERTRARTHTSTHTHTLHALGCVFACAHTHVCMQKFMYMRTHFLHCMHRTAHVQVDTDVHAYRTEMTHLFFVQYFCWWWLPWQTADEHAYARAHTIVQTHVNTDVCGHVYTHVVHAWPYAHLLGRHSRP